MLWFNQALEIQNHDLKEENRVLRARVESLEERYQELMIRVLEKISPALPAAPKPPLKHKIQNSVNRASCTCGWVKVSDDPATLQGEIAKHYRENTAPGSRTRWSQGRQLLEAQGEQEDGNQ